MEIEKLSVTYKKLLFSKHFARTKNRRSAVEAAGYGMKDWRRTAVRLLQDSEVLALVEQEQNRLLKREEAKRMTRADVIGELGEMLVAASDKPGRSGWSARLKVLEVMGRLLSREDARDGATDEPESTKLSDGEVEQRIAALTAQLAPATRTEQGAITAAPTPDDIAAHKQGAIDAPQSAGEARATDAVSNPALVPQSADERLQRCGTHGDYLSVRSRGSWSYCPKCVKEWERNERWLASLAPAGDGRK